MKRFASNHYGGHLADIPEPHIRMYPTFNPRRVRVRIWSWAGMSLGAKHIYTEFIEDDNPIWDTTVGCWRLACDDKDGNGKKQQESFLILDIAVSWARSIIKIQYSDAGCWKVVDHDGEFAEQYFRRLQKMQYRFLQREGD